MDIQLTHDFSDFNPEGFSFPPSGFYAMTVAGAESKTKDQDKGGYAFVTLTFQIAEGEQKGQQFKIDYNTGYPKSRSEKAGVIAMENIARIFFAATGTKPGRSGLNIGQMVNKPFGGNLTIEEKKFTRDDGSEGAFKNAKLNGLQRLENNHEVLDTAVPEATPTNSNAAPWANK